MKAIVYEKYGSPDVLHMADVDRPTPSDDQVLVKIHAVSINGSDWESLVGRPAYARLGGLFRPRNRILGSDIAGQVVSCGRNNTEFQPGDEVFGILPDYHGGFAEYVCTQGRTLIRKPAGLSFEQAAAIPQGGTIAFQAIRAKDRVQPGQRVLINGAGGSAGCFAIQLAKLSGAEVTGVDNPAKLDFMRSLGADHVVDYTREDFATSALGYDLILDFIAHRSALSVRRALQPGGTYYFVGGSVAILFQILLLGSWIRRSEAKNLQVLAVPHSRQALTAITELCQAGKVVPVIDRTYSLSEAAEALRYVGAGRAKGKVILRVDAAAATQVQPAPQ